MNRDFDFNELSSTKCISCMSDNDREAFLSIAKHYYSELNDTTCMSGSDDTYYTLHDFNHHCRNIYGIISNHLLESTYAFDSPAQISSRELFLLNLAVLFHDKGMHIKVAKRSNHSFWSADYVQKENENSSSVLCSEGNLCPNEIKALCAIIRAHSDIKNMDEFGENVGMKDSELIDYKTPLGKTIRTKLLAYILRLADELDVTSNRLGNTKDESSLEYFIDILKDSAKDSKQLDGFNTSKFHWYKLHLFAGIERTNREIILITDDKFIRKQIAKGTTIPKIKEVIDDVIRNIQNRINELSSDKKVDNTYTSIIPINCVSFKTDIEELAKLDFEDLEEYVSPQSIVENELNSTYQENPLEPTNKNQYQIIDQALASHIKKEITERNLIQIGHYRLTDIWCARDWINTLELVETKDILNKITLTLSNHILKNFNEIDYMIVGVDLIGAMIAARVAFILQRPFSYLISPKNKNSNTQAELIFENQSEKKLILITDAIVSGTSITTLTSEYDIKEKIECIYTLLYRYNSNITNHLSYKVFTINGDFPIELSKKDECHFIKATPYKCFAANKKIYEDQINGDNDSN